MASTDFSLNNFIRTGGQVSFEERAAQPSDFTASRGFGNFAAEYAANPTTFMVIYPDWQKYADAFVVRRAVVSVTARQRCCTNSFGAHELEKFVEPGFVTVRSFAVPGSDRGSIPGGKYQLTSFSATDSGEGYTDIAIGYQQSREWKLIKIGDVAAPVRVDGATGS